MGLELDSSTLPARLQGPRARENESALRAMAVYGLYRALGELRHTKVDQPNFEDIFDFYIREAARGHRRSLALLCMGRKREGEG